MKLRMPSYCERFKCSADKCSDNCCIGWEIDIDESTARYYDSVKGNFGEKLKENITDAPCRSFILQGERCPFLNDSNLCEIIINLGEDKLCQICTDHPRYYEWYGEIKEGGIGLCCEEAAKLILNEGNPLSFTEKEVPFEEGEEVDRELFEALCFAREEILRILCDERFSFGKRIGGALDYGEKVQQLIDNYCYELPSASIEDIGTREKGDLLSVLKSLCDLEPIDDNWSEYLKKLIDGFGEAEKQDNEFASYERNVAIYFIYRYFLKGVFDGEILSKVKLAAVSVAVIGYIIKYEKSKKGKVSFDDMVASCKCWSKQVEYSEENLDMLAELSYEKACFESESIKGLYNF